MKRTSVFVLLLMIISVANAYSADYGIKAGYLYLDGSDLKERYGSFIAGVERFSYILPVLALNLEVGYSKSTQEVDMGQHFDATFDTRLLPITANLLLTFGTDMLQVYAGGGLGGYLIKNEFHIINTDLDIDISGSETNWYWGFQVKAGLKYWLTDTLGIYTEYQYRRYGEDMTISTNVGDMRHDGDIELNQISAGIVFSFF